MNKKHIDVFIVEDIEVIRCGLNSIIESYANFRVIGEAESFSTTLRLLKLHTPDVILLDLALTDGDCVERIPEITQLCPDSKILIYTASTDKEKLLQALELGVTGILYKSQSTKLLCKAIQNVCASSELWVDKALVSKMWQQYLFQQARLPANKLTPIPLDNLTERERSVAYLSAKGMPAKEIGEHLFISEKTVRNKLTRIYSKLGVKNQLELSIKAYFPEDFLE